MYSIIRMCNQKPMVIFGQSKNDCIKEAYEDYKKQMKIHYEDGAFSPCDNFNSLISFDEFKNDFETKNQSGYIVASQDHRDISFDYKSTENIIDVTQKTSLDSLIEAESNSYNTYFIVRMCKTKPKIIFGQSKDECIQEAYKDYREQMTIHYENGASSPCDNLNSFISFDEFKNDFETKNQSGYIVALENNNSISFDYKLIDDVIYLEQEKQLVGIDNIINEFSIQDTDLCNNSLYSIDNTPSL